jgi:HSP20 family protein
MERSYGTFQRSLRLPFPVEPQQVKAEFNNGVLTVTLPKTKAQERSHRIAIQGGGRATGTSEVEVDSAARKDAKAGGGKAA